MLKTITETFEGITITVGRPSNRDRNLRDEMYIKIGSYDSRLESYRHEEFSKLIAYTKKIEGSDIKLPTAASTTEEVRTAYEAYLEWDGVFTEWWLGLIEKVCAPADIATGPRPISEDADPNS